MTLKEELLSEIETMTETQIAEFIMMIKNMKNEKPNFHENQVEKLTLGECIAKFREKLIEESIEINPDEIWGNIREYHPGREVIW
ncbi:hypothetical protein [Sphaerospermopsis torques-reginae]|uniref:Uncharacterized protein n=1 Tax=Sphaerospermopsis torques-reginae ITEP-024 TaxID=984208 RepID=A0ABX8WY93_9CYAN|nr:hypothetical protein [Sphaerospermopsis torques-reginae]QYX31421.1 hypothetical protein K2F26_21860 [Sphaerospermopsis torques-reginae ITEP-024]